MDAAALKRRVADNLARVQANIAAAAQSREITLVCVTKYAEPFWMEALLEAGATDLAENLLPRAGERFSSLYDSGYRFTRHLIGAQQSRKLALIPGRFDWLQALDRMDSAQALAGYLSSAKATLEVLLQVNIAREEQKHGFMPEEIDDIFGSLCERFRVLRLRGLMAIPPGPAIYSSDTAFERETRIHFRQTYELFAKIRRNYPNAAEWNTLSLGMSQDYTWAIAEGATMVRVGSALFEGLEG
jgi:PLP dependent protein